MHKGPNVSRDSLADLLAYQPSRTGSPTNEQFLRNSLSRLERGDHVYTCVEKGVLISHVWVAHGTPDSENGRSHFSEQVAPGSIVLDDFFASPTNDARNPYLAIFSRIIAENAESEPSAPIHAVVAHTDSSARHLLEKLGFVGEFQPTSGLGSAYPIEAESASPMTRADR